MTLTRISELPPINHKGHRKLRHLLKSQISFVDNHFSTSMRSKQTAKKKSLIFLSVPRRKLTSTLQRQNKHPKPNKPTPPRPFLPQPQLFTHQPQIPAFNRHPPLILLETHHRLPSTPPTPPQKTMPPTTLLNSRHETCTSSPLTHGAIAGVVVASIVIAFLSFVGVVTVFEWVRKRAVGRRERGGGGS